MADSMGISRRGPQADKRKAPADQRGDSAALSTVPRGTVWKTSRILKRLRGMGRRYFEPLL
jgi:hypothetical protein